MGVDPRERGVAGLSTPGRLPGRRRVRRRRGLGGAAHDNGTSVWCYLSVGSAENYRDDYPLFEQLDAEDRAAGGQGIVGAPLGGWPGERWLNVRRYEVFLPILEARLDVCADKGFDMVEFDNIDAYDNNTSFRITPEEQIVYLEALVSAAEERGLAPIQKNATDLPISDELRARFGGLLMESCVLWDFCSDATPYRSLGIPVWNVEYPDEWVCDEERAFSALDICTRAPDTTLLKNLDLDARTVVCADLRRDDLPR